jgi:hypothetical protein
MRSATIVPAAVQPTDAALLARVLRCYKPHCRYLTSMTVEPTDGVIRGRGELTIAESCYIDDTGHLNSVEVNICYNQMLYYVIAKSVQERLEPVFADWTMDDYWRRQLPDILIFRLTSTFRSPIDRRRFFGEFTLTGASRRRLRPDQPPMISLDTAFRCWDDHGGESSGQVKVGIVGS